MTVIRLTWLSSLLKKEEQASKAGSGQSGLICVRQCLRHISWTLFLWSQERQVMIREIVFPAGSRHGLVRRALPTLQQC